MVQGERSEGQHLCISLSSEDKFAPLARLTLCGKLTAKICPTTWALIKNSGYASATAAR
jgi:hypothetical protein